MGKFVSLWAEMGAEQWVVECLRLGYSIPFLSPPPLSLVPVVLSSYRVGSVRHQGLLGAVLALLAKDAIEPVAMPASPGFYGRLFVVPKPDGSWRPILDVSALNIYVRQTRFKMESSSSVLASVLRGV